MEESYDWSTVHKKVFINVNKQIVSDAWLNLNGFTKWFLREAIYTSEAGELRTKEYQTGDSYLWRWFGYADDVNETGQVLSTDPFEFSYSFAGNSICKVSLQDYKGGTLLKLSQSNIPTNEKGKSYYHVGCSNGWTFYLTNLKSVLEGGLDLRNKDESMQNLAHA